MKQTRFDLSSSTKINKNPFSLSHKSNQLFLRLGVCFILLGLIYSLIFSHILQFSPLPNTIISSVFLKNPPFPSSEPLPPPVSDDLQLPGLSNLHLDQRNSSDTGPAKCDIFVGDWVRDPTAPFYTNNSCSSIENHQNCMKNGRPDSDYLYWRWIPRDCDLPRFDPEKFLDIVWNKSMAFIGDSIMRNYVQSLLCTLSQVEQAVEVYHTEDYRSRRWHFPSRHFTLSVLWSPFITEASIFEDYNGVSSGIANLYLDKLNPEWFDQYKYFDYIVLAGGKWFLKPAFYYENDAIVGCHSCPESSNVSEVGFEYAYRKALNTTFKFLTSTDLEAKVFFRTITPDHFEYGDWDTGGVCNRTVPFEKDEAGLKDIDRILHEIELDEFEKAAGNGSSLKLFNTTRVSLLRPDGHPGPYRAFHPFEGKTEKESAKVQRDCLHWCLPGPLDTWNDLMLNMMTMDD